MKSNIKKRIYVAIGVIIYSAGSWIIYDNLGKLIAIAASLMVLGVLIAQMGDNRKSNKKDSNDAQ